MKANNSKHGEIMNTEVQQILTHLRQGKHEDAMQDIQFLLLNADEQTLYELAQTLQTAGFLNEAIHLSEEAHALWHTDEWLLLLAECYVDNSQFDEALDTLGSLSSTSDYYPSALLMMAELYQLEELYEVAERKLMEAKTVLPYEPIIDLALAELYFLMGEYENALYKYHSVKDDDIIVPTDWVKKVARTLIVMGKFEETVTYLEQLNMDEHDSDSLFELGLAYFQLKEYERAIRWFDELLVRDPDYLSANYYLAHAYLETNRAQKAITLLEKAVEENPYQAVLYHDLYTLYTGQKHGDKLATLFDKAKDYISDDVQMALLYSYYLKEKEDYEGLVEYITAQFVDEDSEFDWLLAYAYGKLEEDEKAQAYYTLAYVTFKEDVQFLEDYYFYLREIGKRDEMANILSEIKTLDSDIWGRLVSE